MTVDWPRSLHTLYTPPQMRAALHRERLRADRTDGTVSVAVFEMDSASRESLLRGRFLRGRFSRWRFRRLARLVLKRARLTDEVGWLSDRQICAVLPGTGSFGAYCFADAIRAQASRRGMQVGYTLYCYPQTDLDPPDGHRVPADLAAPAHHPPAKFRRDPAPAPQSDPAGVPTGVQPGFARTSTYPAGRERRGLMAAINLGMASMTGDTDDSHEASAAPDASVVRPMQLLLATPLPVWKRAMDLVGATIGLAVTAPLMAVTALLIRFSSPGPVVFRQRRAGLGDSRFTIYKFRTMVRGAEQLQDALRPQSEQDGPAFKMTDDPRVTRVGRFLRCTSLDELPQLWNVLLGQMSLVGPRPLPVEESQACDRWHRRRLDVMPGLTCIWQVRGRSRVSFDDWMRMDMEYLRNRSFLHDMKILLLTIPAVVLRRGAH